MIPGCKEGLLRGFLKWIIGCNKELELGRAWVFKGTSSGKNIVIILVSKNENQVVPAQEACNMPPI